MTWRCLLGSVGMLLTVVHGGPGWAGMIGNFDSRVQVDNRYFDGRLTLEQRGEITLHDRSQQVRMGASFALRQRDERGGEVRINRLFAGKRFPAAGVELTLGRTERSDSLGFYTLDGVILDWSGERLGFHFYAGIPGRIDDYRSIEGEALHGIELHFHPSGTHRFLRQARLGWQHYRDETSSDRLSWGMAARTKRQIAYLFTGVYAVQEARFEEISGQFRGEAGSKGTWQLSGQIWQPRRPWLTFRERFYSLYARGRQSVVRGDLHYRPRKRVVWSLSGRHVAREQGDTGGGLSAGAELRGDSGWRREFQFTLLRLGDEVTGGAWFQFGKPVSSRSRVTLRTALQYQNKALYGVDRSAGAELDMEQMIRADLYFSLFASYLWNSRLDDEYRAGARLTWYLDGYRPGKTE